MPAPETRLAQIRTMLNDLIGSRSPNHEGRIGTTGPTTLLRRFWDLPRNDFVESYVYQQKVIVVGQPADSALIKALKGVRPFDGTLFDRMPPGGPYLPDDDIDFIAQWITDGAPDNDPKSVRK